MEKITQLKISQLVNISPGMMSGIMNGKARPSWATAKRLAETTGTDPVLWLEGTPDEIRKAIEQEAVNA